MSAVPRYRKLKKLCMELTSSQRALDDPNLRDDLKRIAEINKVAAMYGIEEALVEWNLLPARDQQKP